MNIGVECSSNRLRPKLENIQVAPIRKGLDDVMRQLHVDVGSARTGDQQNRWLRLVAIGVIFVEVVLWTLLAGPILRRRRIAGDGRKAWRRGRLAGPH